MAPADRTDLKDPPHKPLQEVPPDLPHLVDKAEAALRGAEAEEDLAAVVEDSAAEAEALEVVVAADLAVAADAGACRGTAMVRRPSSAIAEAATIIASPGLCSIRFRTPL